MSKEEMEKEKQSGHVKKSDTPEAIKSAAKHDAHRPTPDALERAFLADDLIPDPAAAFIATVPPVDKVINNADIVLDTNVLLLPYGTGSSSLSEIVKALKTIADRSRLFLPGQVVREFIRNRPIKLADLQQQLQDKTSRFVSIDVLNFPILEGNEDYRHLNEVLEQTIDLKKKLNNASRNVLRDIKSWEWNDPVYAAYKTVFMEETIVTLIIEREEAFAELERRQRLHIPPGYKDASKDDYGIGDLLIWFTVLDLAKKNKNPLIFVSGDEKSDWQHRSGNSGFLPRYELLDEYRRSSSGQPFYIVPLSKLLEMLNVEKNLVEQVKHEEVRIHNLSNIIIKCPECESDIPCTLGEYIGATTHTCCQKCSTPFYVHRTRSGITIHADGNPGPREREDCQAEEVICPNCGSAVQATLGLYFNATRWCNCTECGSKFPIHRRSNGEVLVSKGYRNFRADE